MIINLTKEDVAFAKNLAKKRHDAKHISIRNKGVLMENNLASGGSQYDFHTIGLIGELAYSKFSGESIDENIYSSNPDPKGQDFENLEIKTITYFGSGEPELKITQKEYATKTPKLYVLARTDKNKLGSVELLGRISREKFDKLKVAKKYGRFHPSNWIVPLSLMEKL
jgi:hypothetical protein